MNKFNTIDFCKVFSIFILLVCFNACNTNPLEVDTSDINIEPLQVSRLEQDLFQLEPTQLSSQTKKLKKKYGIFYEHYLMNFLCQNGSLDSNYSKKVLEFTHDRDVHNAYLYSQKIYTDEVFKKIETELNESVKRFHYHFPEKPLPTKLITCTSGWNFAVANMDSAFIIALDMYLGDTCSLYQMLRYPQYQVRKMNPQNILSDAMRGWMLTEFDKSEASSNLLSHTIFYGKLFYAIQALLPNANDSLIIGYSQQQMDYCKKYEKQLWGYFAEKNRLYETNLNTVRELTSDGPFTGAIHKDCPPRIAMWVGWQIVKQYMKNNSKISLSDFMKNNDAPSILSKSKYRP